MRRQEARRVGTGVLVGLTPLEALGGDPVGRQRAAARREAARDDNGLVCQPRLVVGKHPSVERHVLRAQVRLLVGLRVDPAQRLQPRQHGAVARVGQRRRQADALVRAHLRHHGDAVDLLHLRVVRRRHAEQVARHLRAQVRDGDEALEHVLRQDVSDAVVAHAVVRHVDVPRAQVQVRGRQRALPPVGARGEAGRLVRRLRRDQHLVAVLVHRLGGDLGHVGRLLARLALQLGDLLALLAGRRDLHPQDDVADLRLRQAGHVDVVLLAVVLQDEVLQAHLHLDPLLVRERRPDVVRLRDRRLVRAQDDLAALRVHVQRPQDEHQAREGRVRGNGVQPVVVQVEEQHLWLRGAQDEVAEALHLEARLEGQLQL
mmetsp:Transcript_39065/g.93686  ORF Transcript_39065/g.93686 Transcript_39065/m.93686 type:complete len:373 (-) Transcript_39065:1226-2344(-)